MSRDSSGNYTLPAGNPVVTGTTIESAWANTTLTDIANSLTNSLDRTGKGGMTAPLLLADGTVSLPTMAFVLEPTTGWYRAAAGDIRLSIAGTAVAKNTAALMTVMTDVLVPSMTVTGTLTAGTLSGSVAWSDITSTPTTLGGYGITDAATFAQGALADTATQPGDNVSTLTNDSGYITSYTETDTLDSVTDRGATTTNAVTVGNLTSTGIDDNASATAVTIDSSGNVGIGTASPSTALDVNGTTTTDGLALSGRVTEEVFAVTGTTPALDPQNGTIQTWTLSGNSTPTFAAGFTAGASMTLMIDDGSAYSITWPTTQWAGGSAPTLATTGYTVVELWNVGATVYGALVGEMS
jgi:hypothetical protein